MFAAACDLYGSVCCQVGGGSNTVEGRLFGSGCLISHDSILTAYHVIKQLPPGLNRIVAITHAGLVGCELVWHSVQEDLAVLRVSRTIQSHPLRAPAEYPKMADSIPRHGTSVGFMARMRMPNGDTSTYFAPATISMLIMNHGAKGARYMLSDGIVQSGFSGSAVFTPAKELVGVVVESFQFPVDSGHQSIPLHTRPAISLVGLCKREILTAAGN